MVETAGFVGQAALVTGASGGIGGETARRLAAAGALVAINYNRSADRAQALLAEIEAAGGRGVVVQGDAADPVDAERMVRETVEAFGRLDILVNNAGISTFHEFGKMTAADIDRELAVNVRSVVLMTQAAAAHLKGGGRIVNLSSNLAVAPMPGLTLYCAAKAAVASLTQGFARELGALGIRVNAVAPGATETPMTAWLDQSVKDGIAAGTPLGRIGQPADIADAILFLASDRSAWVSGRTLIIDGGLV